MLRYAPLTTPLASLALAWIVLLPPGETPAADTPRSAVRIGLVNTLFRNTPQSMIQLLSRPLRVLMEQQTGLTGTLLVAGDAERLGQQLTEEGVQLGVFHGVEFAWARKKYPDLKPLVVAINHHRVLRAYLVVAKDSGLAQCEDLRGKILSLSCLTREHCNLFLQRRCLSGEVPDRFFSRLATTADEDDALSDVVEGLSDAALVDGVALERFQEKKADRFARLRVLLASEPFPAGVIAYRPGTLDEATLQRFRAGMIEANQNKRGRELMTMCRITAFEPVPADFDKALADILEAYPPPPPGK